MIKALLAIIALVIPFAELLRFQIRPEIYLRFLDLLALFLLALFVAKNHLLLFRFRAYLVLVVIFVISNLVNTPNLTGLSYLLRTVLYLSLLPYLVAKKTNYFKVNKLYLNLGLVLFLLGGFLQYFFYPQLRNLFYLGYDPHAYRWAGLFLDPNLSSLVLVWAFWYFWQQHGRFVKTASVLSLVALLLTYSRIGYLCFFVGLLYTMVKIKPSKKIYGLVLVMVIGIFLLPRYFGEGTNLARLNSLLGKYHSSQLAYKQIVKKPILGIGFNNLFLLKRNTNSQIGNNSLHGVDNSFLTVLTTTGLLGILSFFWLYYQLWQKQNKQQRLFTLIFLVHCLSVNSFFTPSVYVYYLLFVASQRK
jgi:O-antigen ligase